MASTRRLAAILAADMVGYSRLMGHDDAGTVRELREHRAAADPIIAEHGGRIVKTTGDGLLIEFGSLVGAVECALALQRLAAERNAEVSADRFHVDGPALVREGRIAGYDEQPADAGERGDDLLDHAVDEIFLLGIAAHIGEGQHRDRGLVG